MRWHGVGAALGAWSALLMPCTRVASSDATAPAPPAVYLVIVDGLGADVAVPDRLPGLAAAVRERGSWLTATVVMPTRTNPNHASLLTGVYPDTHGITGNWYWDGRAERELDEARLLEVETLFTAIERQRPRLVTVAAFAKRKLRRLFAAAPDRQVGADVSWGGASPDAYSASDDDTMQGFRDLVRPQQPAFSVVALADVDRVGHRDGPGAATYTDAVVHVDRLLAAFIDELRRQDRWRHAVVIVTADHGFDALRAGTAGQIEPAALVDAGAHLVSDGGVAHVYADTQAALAGVVVRARDHAGVAAAYALGDWHLDHPRSGDVLLVARRGFTFVGGPTDPTRAFRGNHGGPGERLVPLIVAGGHPSLRTASATLRPSTVDVAPTIAHLLGIAPPRRLDRGPVPRAAQGRVLTELFGGE